MAVEKIEDLFLKENYLLGLIWPDKGYVFFHIENLEPYQPYIYDRILNVASLSTTGQISTDEHLSAVLLKDADGSEILEVDQEDVIYQMFYSINPSALKTYWYFSKSIARGAPLITTMVDKAKFGYIDGFQSPLGNPSPASEKWIPYGRNLSAFAFHNPLTRPIRRSDDPLMKFEGMMYAVKVIEDVDLIYGIVHRRINARLATLGGLDPFDYDTKKVYGVNPVPFMATREQIQKAVQG